MRSRHCLALMMIALVPPLLGLNNLAGSFQYDDSIFIVEGVFSDRIKDFHLLWRFFLEGGYFQRIFHWATLALNYHAGRLNPLGYHLVNLLLHAWNGCLVYALCWRLVALLPGKYVKKARSRVSFFPLVAALLFLSFPVQTETTAYISSRSSSLVSFFYLLGTLFFLESLPPASRRIPPARRMAALAGTGICFLMGLGVKKTVMSLPIMLFFIFFLHSDISLTRFIRKYRGGILLLFFLCALIPGAKVYSFYKNFEWNAPVLEDYNRQRDKGYVDNRAEYLRKRCFDSLFLGPGTAAGLYSPLTYWMTEIHVVPGYYLRKIFFPFALNISPDIPIERKWRGRTAVLALGVLLSFCVAWRLSPLSPILPLALTWFFVALLPTSSFIPLYDVASEHRTYPAMPGCAMGAGFLIFLIEARASAVRGRALYSTALALLFVSFAALFMARNSVWQSDLSLWSDSVRKSPRSGRTHHNLGLAYAGKNFLSRAILEYNKALEIEPAADTYVNLAEAYKKSGLSDKAVRTLRVAIKTDPEFPQAYYNLGVLYHDLGRDGDAILQYQRAIEVNEDYPEAYNNLGELYVKQGKLAKARKYFEKALGLRSFHLAALNNLATVYQKENNLKQAEFYYRKALRENARRPEAHFNLGTLYLKQGRLKDAEGKLREAIRLDGKFEAAYAILGDCLIKEGRFREAMRFYKAALRLQPDDSVIHRNLGILYYNEMHDPQKAVYHFRRTLELDPDQEFAGSLQKIIREHSTSH